MPITTLAERMEHDRLYRQIRRLLLAHIAHTGISYSEIGRAANLSTPTVRNFFWHNTARPHFMTLIKLARYFNLEFTLRPAIQQRRRIAA